MEFDPQGAEHSSVENAYNRCGESENVCMCTQVSDPFHGLCLFPSPASCFYRSVVAHKLVLRAGFPQRDINGLSCSLSCSLGLVALMHHGTIILELDVYKKRFNISKNL